MPHKYIPYCPPATITIEASTEYTKYTGGIDGIDETKFPLRALTESVERAYILKNVAWDTQDNGRVLVKFRFEPAPGPVCIRWGVKAWYKRLLDWLAPPDCPPPHLTPHQKWKPHGNT